MNCANHADASAVAYCRTCGKPLCANCTRPVRGIIYCEDCLGAKMEGTAAGTAGFVSSTFPPAASGQVPPPPSRGSSSGPNPTVAGILGAIPFGIGAVYNGQYAKGLAHMGIFALLVAGCNSAGDVVPAISGFGIVFLILYGIIDSVRSARAIQAGLPAPDPFGLAATFSGGARVDTSKIPMGAIVLILVGVIFLLHTAGLLELNFHRFWGVIFILLGGWIFATRRGLIGGPRGCPCQRCRAQCLMGPAILVTVGVIGLIDSFRNVGFFGYVGGILLVIGGVKLLQGTSSAEGHNPALAACAKPAGGPIPPEPPEPPAPPIPPVPPDSEVNRG